MFDDPKKELQNLEDQLLAAESNHETAKLDNDQFEELYDTILEEFGPLASQNGAEPPIRNFANGYGSDAAPGDETADHPKGGKGLVLLVCLEIMAIAALAAYWVMELL